MPLFYQPDPLTHPFLSEEESRHCVKTLRLKKGDLIDVTDGQGNRFSCVIETADPRRCTFRMVERHTEPARPYGIHLAVAPTKNLDRIEWFVEKAVELGIDALTFYIGNHSERRVLKTDRIEKIAVAAMKQSLQSRVPAVTFLEHFRNVLNISAEQRFIAHLDEEKPTPHLLKAARPGASILVLIGPEGDFSEQELKAAMEAGFVPITLGKTRLRTETAALAACHTVHLVNE